MRRYEEIEHTADLAIKAYGRDIKELFANAAYGMFSAMGIDLEAIKPTLRREVRLEAPDREALLVDWLNELLYLHETEGEIYADFDIHALSETELRANIMGTKGNGAKIVIKAATFHNLEIARMEDGYAVTITFDV